MYEINTSSHHIFLKSEFSQKWYNKNKDDNDKKQHLQKSAIPEKYQIDTCPSIKISWVSEATTRKIIG